MAIIGSASIQIRADDKYFEPDVRRAVRKIKNVVIELKADADISKASKKIRDLRYRITSKDAVLKVDADVTKADAKMAALLSKFLNKDFNWEVKANTQGANTALRELSDRYANRRIPFTAVGNTTVARAALAAATRPRNVAIRPYLDPASTAALRGLFNTLTGTLPFEKVKAAVAGVAANFEGMAVAGAKLVTILGAIGAVGATAGANLFGIAGSLVEIIGLAAAAPAVMTGMAATVLTGVMAWKGFGDAAKGGAENLAAANKALAKLPPQAQAAALALRGVGEQIQQPTQNAFWKAVGTSLQDMVAKQLPSLISGFERLGTSFGGLSKEAFDTIGGLGDFNDVFDNIAVGMDKMKSGIKPAIQGLATFTGVGSRFLPRLGTWMGDLGKQFGAFADKSAKNGDILRWIEEGITTVKNLGSIVKSTTGIFNGLVEAARESGAPGLKEMADGMRNIAGIVNGEPFQSRLVAILEGARSGTDKLSAGLKTLTTFFSENAVSAGLFLEKAGAIGGLTFERIKDLFDGTGLGSGIFEALDGLEDALKMMEPGFRDFGTAIGDLGEIAGELFRSMAPGLNMLADTISGVVAGLKDGILDAMPVLNEFIQSILGLVSGPVQDLASGIGDLLSLFADLPSFAQIAIAAITGFILLRPKLMGMFNGLSQRAATAFGSMATTVDAQGNRAATSFGRSATAITTAWGNVGRALNGTDRVYSTARTGLDRIATGAQNAGRAIGTTAGQGLRMAGSGLMTMLGGPWGAALAVAAVGIGLFAAEQAEAKAKVDGLAAALDQQTGAFTSAGKKLLLTEVLDLNADGWDDLARSGRRNMEELAQATGLNMDEVSKALMNPEGRDGFVNNWRAVRDAAGDGNDITAALAASVGMTTEQMKGLSQTDLDNMVRQFEKGADMAEKAEAKVKAVADAMGTNSTVSAALAKNYDTLSDATASAAEKFDALKQNLDLISGGQESTADAAQKYQQNLHNTREELKKLVTDNGGVVSSTGEISKAFRNTLVDTKGTFSIMSQGGRDFRSLMMTTRDAILEQGTAALKAAQMAEMNPAEAIAASLKAMAGPVGTFRKQLEDMGFDAGQVKGILAQLGLNPEQLKGALSVDTEDAEKKIARAMIMVQAFASGNFSVALSATTDKVKDALTKTGAYKKAYEEGGWEAVVDVINKGGPKIEDFILKLSEAKTDKEVQAILDAEFRGDPAYEASKKAKAAHNAAPPPKKAVLDAENKITPAVEAAKKSIAEHDQNHPFPKVFNAKDEVTPAAGTAKTAADQFNGLEFLQKKFKAVDEVTPPALLARAEVDKFNEKQLFDKTFKATDGVTLPAFGAKTAIEGVNGLTPAEKFFKGVDQVTPPATTATGAIEKWNGVTALEKLLSGVDEVTPPASIARDSVIRFNETSPLPKALQAFDQTAPAVGSAQGTMNSLQPVTRDLFGLNSTAPAKNAAQGTLNSLTPVSRDLFGINSAGPGKNAAQGTMNSLSNVTRDLFASNKAGGGKNAAQGTINSLTGKSVDLNARDNASGVIDNIDRKQIAPKTFSIMGVLGGVSAVVRRALGMASGGIMSGSGVQTFANGGFSGVKIPTIKAYAGGGMENHVAQIAQGAWPVRVWAEKETGGEAYIPLGKHKRPRSLKILEEVARMFGMSLFKAQKFADGGFSQTRSVVNSPSGGSSSVVAGGGSGVPAAMLNSIVRSLLNDNGGMSAVGKNIVDGIIVGVNRNKGAVVSTMKVLSHDLEDTVKTELDIHSPSKAFLGLGKNIVDGLAIGIKTTASTAIKNMATLANRLYVAASDVRKATGRNVAGSINLINSQKKLNVAWSKMPAWKYTDQIVDYYQRTGRTGNRTLADIVRARDDISARLKTANSRLKSNTAAHAEVVKDISGKMRSEYKLGTNILSDTSSYVPELKFSDVKTYTTGIAARLRGFNTKLQNLRKKGVSPALINEVAQLGSAEGGAVADALLEGSSADIKGINADVAAISSLSTAIGVSTADGMYKAGIDATKGLIKGLTADQKSLTQAATRISNTLVSTVKRSLGIRSPSRVFAEMGKYTTQGYIVGLDAMQPALNRRVDSLINVVPRRSSVNYSLDGTTSATTGVSALGGAASDPVVIQVLPSAGMDEEAVGKAAVRELNWQILSR